MVKVKIDKVTKFLKMLCPWLSPNFYFALYVFFNSSNCYSHILPGIYLIFLKSVLDQLEGLFKLILDLREIGNLAIHQTTCMYQVIITVCLIFGEKKIW